MLHVLAHVRSEQIPAPTAKGRSDDLQTRTCGARDNGMDFGRNRLPVEVIQVRSDIYQL
jgi:hypothetical protein